MSGGDGGGNLLRLPKLTERQQAALFLAVLVPSVLGLYLQVQATQAPPVPPQGAILASLVVEGDGWTIRYVNVTTANNTAFGLLAEAGERLDFEVTWIPFVVPEGKLVTSINGTANGAHGRFWQYWVDGAYGDRASDKKEIFYGSLVLWKFDVPQEGG